ncbi:ribosomal-protein-alanine N-acetyltransferase [Devosia sp. UYZn731]
MTVLVTERLVLRRPRLDDLDAMFAIMSNAGGMRYWSTLPHSNIDVTRTWLDQMVARTKAGGEDFIIEHDGVAIGTVGAGRLPSFGFIIHPDFWRRGFASEASRAFLDYVFARSDVSLLRAEVDPRNIASLTVLGRLGFVETGRVERDFQLGDEWCDTVYLELTRP